MTKNPQDFKPSGVFFNFGQDNKKTARWYIYALLDSQLDLIGYIGRSTQPEKRYHYHLSDGRRYLSSEGHIKPPVTYSKARWIAYLLQEDNPPKLLVLEAVVGRGWPESEERRWIADMILEGHPLTNNLSRECWWRNKVAQPHDGVNNCPYEIEVKS